jgi:hypothetical protein
MLPNQPPPPGWPGSTRTVGSTVSAGFLAVIAAFLLFTGVLAAVSGDALLAVEFGGGGLLLGHGAAFAIGRLHRLHPTEGPPTSGVNDVGESGIAFPYSRFRSYLINAILVLLTLGVAGFAVTAGTKNTAAGWVIAVVAVAFAAFCGWLATISVRLLPGVIVLTPTGIYHRSQLLRYFVPWDAIVEVVARGGTNPALTVKAMPSSNAREYRYTGGTGEAKALPFLVANAYYLGASSVPAYSAIEYYLRNPLERPALDAGASDLRAD